MESLEDQLKDRNLIANKNDSMQENIASYQIDIDNKRNEIDNLNNKLSNCKRENEELLIEIEELKFKLFENNRNKIDDDLQNRNNLVSNEEYNLVDKTR